MSYQPLNAIVAAGNAAFATIYTVPAGSTAIITSITAINTTGGALNITISVTTNGSQSLLVQAKAVAANDNTYYTKGSATAITPRALNAGDYIEAKGSGAGLKLDVNGIRFF